MLALADDGKDHLGLPLDNESRASSARLGSASSRSARSESSRGSHGSSSDASGKSGYVYGSRSNSLTSLLAGSEESEGDEKKPAGRS